MFSVHGSQIPASIHPARHAPLKMVPAVRDDSMPGFGNHEGVVTRHGLRGVVRRQHLLVSIALD
jgi:hypothetical protein